MCASGNAVNGHSAADMPPPEYALICDMDGVLFDTERLCKSVWKKKAREYGYEITDDLFASCIGRTVADSRRLLLEAFGTSFPYDAFYAEARKEIQSFIEENGPPEKLGLHELCAFAAAYGIPLALATSSSRASAESLLKRAGIMQFFSVIVCGGDVACGKPAPDIFLKAAELLRMPPEHCFAAEDSPAGLRAAAAAGMKAIFIPDLAVPDDTVLAHVWKKCESLIEAAAVLKDTAQLHRGRR
ncbi:MAG: HAD family phosphatase [Bacteroides sp.]|nr:HAD family phosphatase [Prevotella sp.]MCM1408635.1 HAD family phosphatase [Treponema brennaborense]MCM1470709.1 HAD family phosphatase [Bacteroides sp.]